MITANPLKVKEMALWECVYRKMLGNLNSTHSSGKQEYGR